MRKRCNRQFSTVRQQALGLAHDPEEWAPVFAQDHARTKLVERAGMVVSCLSQGLRARMTRARRIASAVALASVVSGCGFTESFQRGYVVPEGALEQLPLGASQEQVLIVLGTPSTVATLSGDVFYYISQRTERTAFLPQREVDRRVVAVYFDKNRRVQRLADYGLRDGQVFDFISRTTPTSGQELTYLQFLMKQILRE
jgi:outer membrane protein assembly factor BamE (lipoprotein component of BamABCDE complex)